MKLFWVTTEDHHEDWFVIAESKVDAANFHELEEGYDDGDATATEILEIAENSEFTTGWPTEEMLIELGAVFIQNNQPRVVEIAGKKFCEGMLESIILELDNDIVKASEFNS